MTWTDETEAIVDTVSATFTLCRALGHHWQPWRDYFVAPPVTGWRMSLRCAQCGTVRNDVVNGWGQTVSRSYRYAAGYPLDNVEADVRPPRAAFKLRLAESYGSDNHGTNDEGNDDE